MHLNVPFTRACTPENKMRKKKEQMCASSSHIVFGDNFNYRTYENVIHCIKWITIFSLHYIVLAVLKHVGFNTLLPYHIYFFFSHSMSSVLLHFYCVWIVWLKRSLKTFHKFQRLVLHIFFPLPFFLMTLTAAMEVQIFI